MNQRQVNQILARIVEEHTGSPEKLPVLEIKAKRLQGLPGIRTPAIGKTADGRNIYRLNVGQCRQALRRLKGGPNA